MPEPTSITPLDANVSVSPQVRIEDLTQLRAAGFRCIVNNRPDGEAPDQPTSAELAAEAARLGLDYRYIPVVPGVVTDSDALAFAKVLAGAQGPVLAFCRSGARSTSLWKRARELQGLRD
jgi:sulfide:quinone oxidoreductase